MSDNSWFLWVLFVCLVIIVVTLGALEYRECFSHSGPASRMNITSWPCGGRLCDPGVDGAGFMYSGYSGDGKYVSEKSATEE